jgi:hypothetical protein
MSRHLRIFLLSVVVGLLMASCGQVRAPSLAEEELFTLQYGKMEDQIEMFMTGGAIDRQTRLFMRGGLFRIANGYGNKVMEFTSYGDLISLYYDPDENPSPVLLQSATDPDRMVNRQAHEFPFNIVGDVAVSEDGFLLVEDQVPARVAEYDDELGVMLNRIVVRFDPEGNQLDYLGQEGIGGTYLPFIQRIETTTRGDIVIVTAVPTRTIVFWYSGDGTLLRRVDIAPDSYPVPADQPAVAVLETVFPDREHRRLYLKFNYHLINNGTETGGEDSADYVMSRIYWLEINDGAYTGFVDVPRNVKRDGPMGELGEQSEFQYEFIGTAPGEHLFLLSQESEQSSQLLILNANGRVVRRRTLGIDYDQIIYRDLHISETGILSALLAARDDVRVVWWRTDRLLAGRN